MNTRIEAIRYLASRAPQERYIINGTSSEYLVPEELVNDALGFVRLVEVGRTGASLTGPQRDSLAELKIALEAVDLDLPNDELVMRNPAWAVLREAAERFLTTYDAADGQSAE